MTARSHAHALDGAQPNECVGVFERVGCWDGKGRHFDQVHGSEKDQANYCVITALKKMGET